MEKVEAKRYRKEEIKVLHQLSAKDSEKKPEEDRRAIKERRQKFVSLLKETRLYQEAKQIHNSARAINRGKGKTEAVTIKEQKEAEAKRLASVVIANIQAKVEKGRSPEEIGRAIIESLKNDSTIEFTLNATGNVFNERTEPYGLAGRMRHLIARAGTRGKLINLQAKDVNDISVAWIDSYAAETMRNKKCFEPTLHFTPAPQYGSEHGMPKETMNRLFIILTQNIRVPSARFSRFFDETRRGATFSLALSAPKDRIDAIKIPELREIFAAYKKASENLRISEDQAQKLKEVFEQLATHYIPAYFKEMQRLAAEYRKNPW